MAGCGYFFWRWRGLATGTEPGFDYFIIITPLCEKKNQDEELRVLAAVTRTGWPFLFIHGSIYTARETVRQRGLWTR